MMKGRIRVSHMGPEGFDRFAEPFPVGGVAEAQLSIRPSFL